LLHLDRAINRHNGTYYSTTHISSFAGQRNIRTKMNGFSKIQEN